MITLNLKGSELGASTFTLFSSELSISRAINEAKANILTVMNSFLQTLKFFVKHANLISSNPLYLKVREILDYLFKSISALFELTPYYSIPPKSGLLELIDNIFSFFNHCLRMHDFYPIFNENKADLIHKVILPCLALTPR